MEIPLPFLCFKAYKETSNNTVDVVDQSSTACISVKWNKMKWGKFFFIFSFSSLFFVSTRTHLASQMTCDCIQCSVQPFKHIFFPEGGNQAIYKIHKTQLGEMLRNTQEIVETFFNEFVSFSIVVWVFFSLSINNLREIIEGAF